MPDEQHVPTTHVPRTTRGTNDKPSDGPAGKHEQRCLTIIGEFIKTHAHAVQCELRVQPPMCDTIYFIPRRT